MRQWSDALTFATFHSVLRTFIYDPLVEWQRTKGRELLSEASKNKETGEVTNEEASILIHNLRVKNVQFYDICKKIDSFI